MTIQRPKQIFIQNYHEPACQALVRDFQKLGFSVYSPDSHWENISYFSPNINLGSELISFDKYLSLPPGYMLITCKPHEEDLKAIARQHSDVMILNVAQQCQFYEDNISDIMICPDITTFEMYPSDVRNKILYFPAPIIAVDRVKDLRRSFDEKVVCSFISMPSFWPKGTPALELFRSLYPYPSFSHGLETSNGYLSHDDCNSKMQESFFTIHLKDQEAYGLSCVESMALGTPLVSTKSFMENKTLGRFFVDSSNSIIEDDIEGIVKRLTCLEFDEYCSMSENAINKVKELTSDGRTIDLLRKAIEQNRDN